MRDFGTVFPVGKIGVAKFDVLPSLLDENGFGADRCAAAIDAVGARAARQQIAMIKICVPNAVLRVLDQAIQVHGGLGVCQDTDLARAYAHIRTLRLADGPDDVHISTVAKLELLARAKATGRAAKL